MFASNIPQITIDINSKENAHSAVYLLPSAYLLLEKLLSIKCSYQSLCLYIFSCRVEAIKYILLGLKLTFAIVG